MKAPEDLAEQLERAIAAFAELQTDVERAAWVPRERVPPSVWAPANRHLSALASPSSPGPFRWLASWMPGLCDLLVDPRVNWLAILKAAQVAVSEIVRTAIGWSADVDPKPVLWVMTTQTAAESSMEKLGWLLEDTPCLAPLIDGDVTLEGAKLTNGMQIGLAWSGSPQATASDPWCWCVGDELAKWKAAVGGEGAIVKNLAQRTKAFGRRGKLVLLSSPKHAGDNICVEYEATLDKRRYYVPCLACRQLQPLEWEWVRWPDGDPSRAPSDPAARLRLAARVQADQSAWIECRGCGAAIDSHAAMADPDAQWVRELEDGTFELEPQPRGEPIGVRIDELYHWKSTTSDVVAKFLRALTPLDLQDFWNGCLGLPYKNAQSEIPASILIARAVHRAKVVPSWATTVLSTADTQLNGWWLMIRAWGRGRKSRTLDFGFVETEQELLERCVRARFAVEGSPHLEARPFAFGIDTGGGMETLDGSRTSQIYALVRRTHRALALKGEGDRDASDAPWRKTRVPISDLGKKRGRAEVMIDLYLVNRTHYADEVATLILTEKPEVLWEECHGSESPVYTRQMTSEHKVLVTTSAGSYELWQKRSKGVPNHLWDNARYQAWLATWARVDERTQPTWTPRGAVEEVDVKPSAYEARDEHDGYAPREERGGYERRDQDDDRRDDREGRWRMGP